MKSIRITAGAAILTALAACGGGDTTVRTGPQEVHPSTSRLANSINDTFVEETATPAAPCYKHHCHAKSGHHHYASSANDGSTPIID